MLLSIAYLSGAAEPRLFNRGKPFFKTETLADGLPSNSIYSLAEDSLGFLWMGTPAGLGRYDGKSTAVFSNDSKNPYSISNNVVRGLIVECDGMWVATDLGLDYMKFSDEKFYHSSVMREGREEPVGIRALCAVRTGSSVLAIFEDFEIYSLVDADKRPGDGSVTSALFEKLPNPSGRQYVKAINLPHDRILVISKEGFTVFSADGRKEIAHTPFPSTIDGNMNLTYDPRNSVVYAGWGFGRKGEAFRYDEATGLLHKDDSLFVPENLMQSVVRKDMVIFATDGGGVFILGKDGSVTNYRDDNSSLPGNALYCTFCSSSGSVWFGTYRRGLALFSPELSNFAVASASNGLVSWDIVTGVAIGNDLVALALDGGGVDLYDVKNKSMRNYNTENSTLPSNNVTAIVEDRERFWMTLYAKGVASIDKQTGRISFFAPPKEIEPAAKVWTLIDGGDGYLWVAGNTLSLLDKTTGDFTAVNSTKGALIMSMSRQGRYLWLATRKDGLLKVDMYSREVVERYSSNPTLGACALPTDNIEFVFADSKGSVWFSATGIGLFSLTPDSDEKLRSYGAAEGFSDVAVNSAVEDSYGRLWLGTVNGLYCYNAGKETFTRIADQRLQLEFTPNAVARDGDYIYMGTTSGLLVFDSSLIDFAMTAADDFSFLSVDILGSDERIVVTGKKSPAVTLRHDNNLFTVNFSVPRSSSAGKALYSWRLKGFEKHWLPASEDNRATYTNVPPGKYLFEVRHTLPDGSWSEADIMEIKVLPPWYLTWWAKLLWTLLILAFIALGLYQWYVSMISRQKVKIATIEKNSEQKLNDAKIDFYAKITHELRTPVFLIAAQIEELMGFGKEVVPVRQSYLKGLYRNSRKLNRLISKILDFRKLDLGKMELTVRRRDVRQFLATLLPDFENLCRQKDIDFRFVVPTEPLMAGFDSDKLEMIVTNLVSNAFKYTPEGGEVVMRLSDSGPVFEISVSDNGIGIGQNMQQEIFNPFFRSERGKGTVEGDGIGLAYVKELIELHNGTIKVESEEGKGSTFTVALPKDLPETEGMKLRFNDSLEESDPDTVPAPSTERMDELQNPTAIRSILVIDDEPEVAEFLGNAFRGDYRIFRAVNGEQGVETAFKERPDVVVTDMMMDGMDGFGVLEALRADPTMAATCIVCFTAVTSDDDMIKALDAGADAYFTKPMSLRLLKRQIEKLLQLRSGVQADIMLTPRVASAEQSAPALNKEEQQFLLKCRQVIEENLLNEDFSIELLASKLAMSHSALYKKIRRLTGMH